MASPAPLSTASTWDKHSLNKVLTVVFWPLTVFVILYKVFIQAVNGYITNDFAPVYDAVKQFLAGQPVYTDNYNFTNPHYLYSPSGTLLLAPFGFITNETISRWVFIGFNALCIVLASIILVKMFEFSLKGCALPILLFASFISEGVTNTLVFSNINGAVYLCEVGFLYLLLHNKNWWAGVPLGISLAIKPMLAPLLLLPILLKRWRPFITAFAIPAVLNIIGYYIAADPAEYWTRTVKYLGEVRDYYNNSIAGWLAYWGAPPAFTWTIRIIVIMLGLATIVLLQPYRTIDCRLWLTTVTGTVLLIAFLGGSLGQRYYSIMLIPMVMTIVSKASFLKNWPAWLAIYLILGKHRWYSTRWITYGRWFEYSRATIGWLLLLIIIFIVSLWRYRVARKIQDPTYPTGKTAFL